MINRNESDKKKHFLTSKIIEIFLKGILWTSAWTLSIGRYVIVCAMRMHINVTLNISDADFAFFAMLIKFSELEYLFL
jgi:hypothetical protein